jgi:hypothetical protein
MTDSGERGPRGDHGQHGETGARGERGKTGAAGKIPRKIEMSFIAIVLAAFSILAVMGWNIQKNRQLAQDGEQAHDAICNLRDDVRRRVDASQQLLDEHPNAKVIFAIPRSVIENSVKGQQATLDALSDLDCEEET